MKLHDFFFAPNPRKTRVYLAEKGIEIEKVTVNIVKGEQHQPAFRALNPGGGLPVLELDDGTVLTESLAIIEYFEELHPEPPMIGTTPLARARVRAIERVCELGVLSRVGRFVHNSRQLLPGVEPMPAVAEKVRAELPGPLGRLDAAMKGREFVAADHPTIADCTLYAAFEFAKAGDLDLAEGHENLRRWIDAFRARPSAQA